MESYTFWRRLSEMCQEVTVIGIHLNFDLFAGAGGFSLGFYEPGEIFVGFEVEHVPLMTYHRNMPRNSTVLPLVL